MGQSLVAPIVLGQDTNAPADFEIEVLTNYIKDPDTAAFYFAWASEESLVEKESTYSYDVKSGMTVTSMGITDYDDYGE